LDLPLLVTGDLDWRRLARVMYEAASSAATVSGFSFLLAGAPAAVRVAALFGILSLSYLLYARIRL